jgi:hypothetical protein
MAAWLVDLFGWVPGVVFPVASGVQLMAVVRAERTDGVSVATWLLFSFANVCCYIYIEKYTDPQSFGYLLAAVLQIGIVVTVCLKRNRARKKQLL